MNDYGYVALTFSDNLKSKVQEFVHANYLDESFYCSPVIESIKGDVTENLHLTVFYGFTDITQYPEIERYLASVNLEQVRIKGPLFLSGFQNLYKVLTFAVDDYDGKLFKLHACLKNKFKYAVDVQHPQFFPHITLAYLRVDAPESFSFPLETFGLKDLMSKSIELFV